jgi:hypothetical protein
MLGAIKQKLPMFTQFVGLRRVEDWILRLVKVASSQNPAAGVFVLKFFGPLPHVSDQIHDAKWAGALRVGIERIRSTHRPSLIGDGHDIYLPVIPPWIRATIAALRRILPLPLMGQALPCPGRISTSISERDPSDRFVFPACGTVSAFPVAEEAQIILRMIVSGIKELLELRVGHGTLVDPE